MKGKHGLLVAQQFNQIPPAGALKVWRLTFSLQLPWFPEGLFPTRTDSFLLSRQPKKHAILVPMMTGVTTNPQGYSHYSHLGQSHGLSLCLGQLCTFKGNLQ